MFVVGLGLLRGEHFSNLFLVGVSLAVAAVPEGLPAVVAITLALGAQRMLKRLSLIHISDFTDLKKWLVQILISVHCLLSSI